MPVVLDALLNTILALVLVIGAALVLAVGLGLYGRLRMALWRRRWRRACEGKHVHG